MKKIKCITGFESAREYLYLDLVNRDLHSEDIRELAALFDRYNIVLNQLASLVTKANKEAISPWMNRIFDE